MRIQKVLWLLLALTVGLLLATPRANAQADPTLKADSIVTAVITHWTGPPQLRVIVTTAPGLRDPGKGLARALGGAVLGDLEEGFTATLSRGAILSLLTDESIQRVSLDLPVRAAMDITVNAVGAAQVWETVPGLAGEGVTVAVVDTGIAPHPDLAKRIVAWQDFVNRRAKPYDDNGHGTHVAGIIASAGAKYRGIAPKAKLIGLKVLDQTGAGWTSDVIKAVDWCISNRVQKGLKIINLSLGHPPAESYVTDPLCRAVRRAWAAGLVVVAPAGNRGKDEAGNPAYFTIDCPGNDPTIRSLPWAR